MEIYAGFITIAFFGVLYLLMKASFKIDDLREEGRHYRYWHSQMVEFIHNYANMRDDRGMSSGDYDSTQVGNRWKAFLEIEREFYNTEESDV